ncbi:hypothetical protein LP422_08660 [Janibacter limosus]|nr:hypothetical protein [Janibacter limosus]UUZ43790.2 hypothetical protein LP422_13470 [Janibacter limosus]UUZ44652.1 hypothetical protein LP422_20325 [Janibacter limosus]UUZ46108.2 hypothetical protein LP422_09940 [Janibacter limosus]UUZ46512.1 hypothetical protein LP422_08660 [Janibacter limosus]
MGLKEVGRCAVPGERGEEFFVGDIAPYNGHHGHVDGVGVGVDAADDLLHGFVVWVCRCCCCHAGSALLGCRRLGDVGRGRSDRTLVRNCQALIRS